MSAGPGSCCLPSWPALVLHHVLKRLGPESSAQRSGFLSECDCCPVSIPVSQTQPRFSEPVPAPLPSARAPQPSPALHVMPYQTQSCEAVCRDPTAGQQGGGRGLRDSGCVVVFQERKGRFGFSVSSHTTYSIFQNNRRYLPKPNIRVVCNVCDVDYPCHNSLPPE